MGNKGGTDCGIVLYFWEAADATEKGSLDPTSVVNSNKIKKLNGCGCDGGW